MREKRAVRDPHSRAKVPWWERCRLILWKAIVDNAASLIAVAILLSLVGLGTAVWKWTISRGEENLLPDTKPDISVLVDQDRIDRNGQIVGGTYIFPELFPNELARAPRGAEYSCSGRYAWAMDQDGVVSGSQQLRVTIESGDLDTLVVTSAKPVLIESGATDPLSGSEVACSGTGGPGIPLLAVDLSQDRADSQFLDGEEMPTEFYFDVTQDKPATFDVTATPVDCDCQWVLEVTTIENGEQTKRTITNPDGSPFRVSSSEKATPVAWDVEANKWLPLMTLPQPPERPIEAPSTRSSGCVVARTRIENRLPERAKYDGRTVPFRLTGDDPTRDKTAGFSSLCNWTYGPAAGPEGFIPTVAAQDWRFVADGGVDQFWSTVMNRMGTSWQRLPNGSLINQDGSVAAWRNGLRVLVVTTVPTDRPVTAAVMGALLQ